MCDYSLESYASRKALAGEDLVLRQFPSHTKGFVAASEADKPFDCSWIGRVKADPCAVCLEPGVELTLHFKEGDKDVTFVTLPRTIEEPDGPRSHKDGVKDAEGIFTSLQSFERGLKATVIRALPKALLDAVASPQAFEEAKPRSAARTTLRFVPV